MAIVAHDFDGKQINQLLEDTIIAGKTIPKGYCNGTEMCKANREASTLADSEFLIRIIHNYLRHEESDYESELCELFGQIGKDDAYIRLKTRITNEIDKTYTDLRKFLNNRNSNQSRPN